MLADLFGKKDHFKFYLPALGELGHVQNAASPTLPAQKCQSELCSSWSGVSWMRADSRSGRRTRKEKRMRIIPRHLKSGETVHEAAHGDRADCEMPIKRQKPARLGLTKGRGGISKSQSETTSPVLWKNSWILTGVNTERWRGRLAESQSEARSLNSRSQPL